MRLTAVVNLHVIVLALTVGAAALPNRPGDGNRPDPMARSVTQLFFFSSAFNILLLDSSIDLDSEGPSGP
jgi:hypothetical protein